MEDSFNFNIQEVAQQEKLPEYLYTDNHESQAGVVIFRCNAASIEEADKLFQEQFGYNPKGESNIGCVTESEVNKKWRKEHEEEK